MRHSSTLFRLTVALSAALISAPLALGQPAAAESTPAPAPSEDFYEAPSPLPTGSPGQLIRSQPAVLTSGLGLPGTTAWTVMYHSRDAEDHDIAVTGTILHPTAPWTDSGPRPYVSFAVGTQGLAQRCAPSKQLAVGSEYEITNILLALARGWGVAVTDYEGYTTGGTPTYVTGPSEGHAVLDIVRAARQVAGTQLTAATPVATWGYSQGGGASAWAASQQPSYAPDIQLVANASGGAPADVKATADYLDGSLGAAFLLYAYIGLAQAYPDQVPLHSVLNSAGEAAVQTAKGQCVPESLLTFPFKRFQDFTIGGQTLEQFEATPSVATTLASINLADQPAPAVPMFQYHAILDEIVPIQQAQTLNEQWCAAGAALTPVQLSLVDHVTADFIGAPAAVNWLADRFAGRPATNTCN